MGLAIRSSASGALNASSGSVVTGSGIAVSVGDLIVVAVESNHTDVTPDGITDSVGNSYTLRSVQTKASSRILLGYCLAATAGGASVTFTGSFTGTGYANRRIAVGVYNPDGATVTLDASAAAVNYGTSVSSGNLSTTGTDELVIAGVTSHSSQAQSSQAIGGTGATVIYPPAADYLGLFYRILTSTASNIAATVTLAANAHWTIDFLAFKATASAESYSGSASISGAGSVVSSGAKGGKGSATVSALGAIAAIGVAAMVGLSAITGGGGVTSAGRKTASAASSVSAAGGTVSTGEKTGLGSSAITAAAGVESGGIKAGAGASIVQVAGAGESTGAKSSAGASTVQAIGDVEASGSKSASGSSVVSGAGGIESTGAGASEETHNGASVVSGAGGIESRGQKSAHGVSLVEGQGSAAASGTKRAAGTSSVTGGGGTESSGAAIVFVAVDSAIAKAQALNVVVEGPVRTVRPAPRTGAVEASGPERTTRPQAASRTVAVNRRRTWN